MKSDGFWEKGLRFQCQGCGNCCSSRGEYGYVYLTSRDRGRLARHLKLRQSTFTRRYCEKTDGLFHLKNPESDCQFFSKRSCSVYPARPEQCRTWPFWPENMKHHTWNTELRRECIGIDKGPLHSKRSIQSALDRDPLNEGNVD